MAIALLFIIFALILIGAWLARIDYLLHGLLEREQRALEEEAERLRRQTR